MAGKTLRIDLILISLADPLMLNWRLLRIGTVFDNPVKSLYPSET